MVSSFLSDVINLGCSIVYIEGHGLEFQNKNVFLSLKIDFRLGGQWFSADRRALGSSLTGITVLCPSLVLFQPRKPVPI